MADMEVFPAYAGMNRDMPRQSGAGPGVPRLRGDEPAVRFWKGNFRWVFPAYAGIDQTLNPVGLVELIGEVSGNEIEAVCIGTGLDHETLDAETVDVLVQLTARVIEVNADFLVREALPVLEAAVGGVGGGVERGVRGWIVRLLAGGFELKDALALPWPVARDYLDALREAEQGRLYEVSLAMRAAQADEKGWRRWVEMVSRPRGKTGPQS